MRYVEPVFRPPSEHDAFILQATLGCSWNHCTYCAMYRTKSFSVRPLADSLADVVEAREQAGPWIRKVFVADGDALAMPADHWHALLAPIRASFPRLKRVSCYATARNVLEKSPEELGALREAGLTRLYIGPESGDDVTLKRLAKGATHDEHVEAARRAHDAGMEISVIALLGCAGVERSEIHAHETARLVTAMDPAFFALLSTTVVPDTPLARQAERGRFTLPDARAMLFEMRTILAEARPTDALFRTNHVSNRLPLAGRLPHDRERLVATIDAALAGAVPLRPEHRGRL